MIKQPNSVSTFISGILIISLLINWVYTNLNAVDKIAPQWLLMTILNGISILFLVKNRSYYSVSISPTLNHQYRLCILLFLLHGPHYLIFMQLTQLRLL